MIIELSIIPLGVGTSVSRLLAPALRELKRRGVRYKITPMCTIFEAESLDEALKVVRAAHEAVFKAGVGRVITTIRIDDRRDLKRSMEEKVESLLGLI